MFARVQIAEDSPVWDVLIIVSSLVIGFIILMALSAGYEFVFPHLLDIPIILYAYRYPRYGVWFAGLVSALYLISYGIILSSSLEVMYPALGRVLIFLVIGATVSSLSYRLRKSENTYRNLFDNLSYAAYSLNINKDGTPGRFIDVNEMMCTAVGYTRDELLAKKPADLVPDAYLKEFRAWIEGRGLYAYGEFESFHIAKDGREIPVEVKLHLFELEAGPIILATAKDVTERYHRDRILKAQRDVAVSLSHAGSSEEAVRLVISFALEISTLDAGAYYYAEDDESTFSSLYSTGFSDRFRRINGNIRAPSEEIMPHDGWRPVYGSADDLVHAGIISGSGEHQKMIGVLPVHGSKGTLGLFLLSSYGTGEIPGTERRLIEGLVAQVGAALERLKVVDALRRNRQNLRSLVDSLDAYQALAGPDGAIITANRSFAAASGVEPETLTGQNIIEATGRSDEFQTYLRNTFADVLESGQAVRFEDDSKEHVYDTILYPVLGSDGSVRAVGMLSTDISPLKEAECALLEAERRYRLVIEALNLGVFEFIFPDSIMKVSPEWYTMLGYDANTTENSYDFWISHIHPDEKESVEEVLQESINSEGNYYNEYRMLAADGTWRWIKSHGKVISWLPDGRAERLIGTHSDITRRRRAEIAFERTNHLLRDAQTIARLGYFEYDVENDLFLPDTGLYEILNIFDEEPVYTFHEFCSFIHPDERDRIKLSMANALSQKSNFSDIFRIICRGGFEIWVRVWIQLDVERDGDGFPIFGTMQDITDVRQTEEELIRTQIAVETSPDEVLYIGPDGEVLYGNQQAVNTYGREGVITGFMIDAIDPAYTTGEWQRHWADLRENRFLVHESRHRKADGSFFSVEVVESYVKVGTREFSCVYCRDISERQRVESAMRESEQRFSLAVAGADLGIYDWDIASDRMVFDARFGNILGFSPTEMEIDKFSDLISLVHPCDRETFRKVLQDYFTNKGAPFFSELRILHTNGTWRWVRARGLIVSEYPEGKPRRLVGTIMDITEQHEAMDSLAEREEQLRETQDMARVGGWVYNIIEDRLESDHSLLPRIGFDAVRIPLSMEEYLQNFVYQEDRAEVEEAYERHLKEYLPFDLVYRILLPDRQVRYVHSRCQTFFDNTGEPIKSVGVIQDITEIKEAENELLEREWKVKEAQRVTQIRFWECDGSTVSFPRMGEKTPPGMLSFLEREGLRIHPDEYEFLGVKFHESVENQSEFSEEFRAVLEENGEILTLYCRGSHYYHTDGTYIRSLGTIMDITERIHTINALRESEKKFRLVAENPTIGTYIIQDHKFVYVNDTCVRLFGYPLEMIIGMYGGTIIAPEMRSTMHDLYEQCIAGEIHEVHLETQGLTQTGVQFPFEVFGSVGEYGGRPALIGNIIDITERKAYEEMLTITRLTVEQATIGIAWINRTGEFIYINKRGVELLRLPAETILGMNVWEIHPYLNALRWRKFWDGLRSGGNRRFETIQGRGDGTSFPANIMVDYVNLSEMEFACIFMTDISRRREAENALHQSLAEKTTLLQEVHHRVKNNLALISSMIQMQMRTLDDEHAVASLTETANRIISMAMVHESIYRSRNITTIDAHEHLTALVNEIVPNFSVGKEIEVEVFAHGCALDLNSGILFSLIVNELITNSIKYAFEGRDEGKIVIVMECSDDRKVLRFSDDGVGIPEDVDPFRQPSLGMNIVHSVVTDQLGGTIELVRGEGTTWVLTFPVKKR